jgi:hypothetical protein
MSAEGLAGFRDAVLTDPGLQRELLAADGRARFISLVVDRARERGWGVEPDDVEEGLQQSRRAWLERWI